MHELLNVILQSLISFARVPYWAIESYLEVNKKVVCFVLVLMSLFQDLVYCEYLIRSNQCLDVGLQSFTQNARKYLICAEQACYPDSCRISWGLPFSVQDTEH